MAFVLNATEASLYWLACSYQRPLNPYNVVGLVMSGRLILIVGARPMEFYDAAEELW